MTRKYVPAVQVVRSVLGWMILIAGISGIAGQTAAVVAQPIATSFTDAFDSQSNYTLIGAGATKTDEPVEPSGNNAVKVSCTTGPTTIGLGRDLGEANKVDFRGMSFRARYYVDPQTQPNLTGNAVNIYFYNGVPNGTNYARIILPYAPGWNTVEFSLTACISHGSFSWSNGVRFYSCSLNVPAGGSYIIWDMLEAWASGARKGAVIFTFDDGYLSEYQEGVLYLNQFGFRSMMYISPEMMGTGSGENAFCTWDQVAMASAAGCLICTHCQSGTPTTGIEAQRDFYRGQKQALIDHGYTAGADYWAIPGGQVLWDDTYLTPNDYYATAKEFFVHIRGTQPYWQQAPDFLGNVTCQPRAPRDIHWGHPVATGTTGKEERNHYWVDKAIENKDVICFMTHRITASGTGAITIAAWRDLVDYVRAKVDAGELEVLTYQDLVGNVQDVPGDTDHDGDVDLVDLGNLAAGYGLSSGATWEQGDFDGDGDVDLVDLGTLAGNYGYGVPAPLNFAADAATLGLNGAKDSTADQSGKESDLESLSPIPGASCIPTAIVLMTCLAVAFFWLGSYPGRKL